MSDLSLETDQGEINAGIEDKQSAIHYLSYSYFGDAYEDQDEIDDVERDLDVLMQEKILVIHELLIAPEYRRKGAATKLVRQVEKRAVEDGVCEAWIHAAQMDSSGSPIGFWKKMGYKTYGETSFGTALMYKSLC